MNKVIRNGMVAVLYSPGYGAGWSTWNNNNQECLFSPEIVKLIEEGKRDEITEELCESLFGERFYAGGADDLEIKWLPEGTPFYIAEYDGSESIKTGENLFIIA